MPGVTQDNPQQLMPLFTASANTPVVNTSAETSAWQATGVGQFPNRTIPANWWVPGRAIRAKAMGTYQTPAVPGSVTIRVKLGGVTLAFDTIAASVLAAGSTINELYGEVMITCQSISGNNGFFVCDGWLTFQTGLAVTATAPFSTAGSGTNITYTSGTTGTPSSTVTVPINTSQLLDFTEQWSNAQAGQGTTITQTSYEQIN